MEIFENLYFVEEFSNKYGVLGNMQVMTIWINCKVVIDKIIEAQ